MTRCSPRNSWVAAAAVAFLMALAAARPSIAAASGSAPPAVPPLPPPPRDERKRPLLTQQHPPPPRPLPPLPPPRRTVSSNDTTQPEQLFVKAGTEAPLSEEFQKLDFSAPIVPSHAQKLLPPSPPMAIPLHEAEVGGSTIEGETDKYVTLHSPADVVEEGSATLLKRDINTTDGQPTTYAESISALDARSDEGESALAVDYQSIEENFGIVHDRNVMGLPNNDASSEEIAARLLVSTESFVRPGPAPPDEPIVVGGRPPRPPLPPPPKNPGGGGVERHQKRPTILQAPRHEASHPQSFPQQHTSLPATARARHHQQPQQRQRQQQTPASSDPARRHSNGTAHPQQHFSLPDDSAQPQRYSTQQYNGAYRRSPPPAAEPPPRQQRQRPPVWKSLWQRIERGLDSLADAEDVVSGRAQQLYSSTVAAVKVPVAVKLPSVMLSRAVKKPPDEVEQLDMSRFRKVVAPPSKPVHPETARLAKSGTVLDMPTASVAVLPSGAMFQKQ